MSQLLNSLYRRLAREEGQTMAEYSVVLTVITVGTIGAIALLAAREIGALTRVAGLIP